MNAVLPQLIHRLVTDCQFRQQFLADTEGAMQAHALSAEERVALHAGIQAFVEPSAALGHVRQSDMPSDAWASAALTHAALAQ